MHQRNIGAPQRLEAHTFSSNNVKRRVGRVLSGGNVGAPQSAVVDVFSR